MVLKLIHSSIILTSSSCPLEPLKKIFYIISSEKGWWLIQYYPTRESILKQDVDMCIYYLVQTPCFSISPQVWVIIFSFRTTIAEQTDYWSWNRFSNLISYKLYRKRITQTAVKYYGIYQANMRISFPNCTRTDSSEICANCVTVLT